MHNAIVGFEQRRNKQPKRITGEDIRDGARSQKQFVGLTSQTGAGCHTQALPIVSVIIKARGKEKIIETYALLDSGSTATFCSDSLLKRLGDEGKTCQLSLATIDGIKENCESSVTNLEILDQKEAVIVSLPNVFSMKRLKVTKEAIGTQEDVGEFAYLQGVQFTKSN